MILAREFSPFGAPSPMRERTGRGKMSFDQQSNCKKINRSILTFAGISVVNPNIKRLIRNLDDLGNDELQKRVNNWLQMSVD